MVLLHIIAGVCGPFRITRLHVRRNILLFKYFQLRFRIICFMVKVSEIFFSKKERNLQKIRLMEKTKRGKKVSRSG